MSKILNLSAHTSDEDLQHLTNLLLFHFVEQCGGQIQFKLEDANRVRESLTTKMVQMQVGDEVSYLGFQIDESLSCRTLEHVFGKDSTQQERKAENE